MKKLFLAIFAVATLSFNAHAYSVQPISASLGATTLAVPLYSTTTSSGCHDPFCQEKELKKQVYNAVEEYYITGDLNVYLMETFKINNIEEKDYEALIDELYRWVNREQ